MKRREVDEADRAMIGGRRGWWWVASKMRESTRATSRASGPCAGLHESQEVRGFGVAFIKGKGTNGPSRSDKLSDIGRVK